MRAGPSGSSYTTWLSQSRSNSVFGIAPRSSNLAAMMYTALTLPSRRRSMAHTLSEKILLAHSDVDDLAPGDVIMVRCDVVMANDVSGPVAFRSMAEMGAK